MTEPRPGSISESTQSEPTDPSDDLERLHKRLWRERAARFEAEHLLEQKSGELFDASEKLKEESARATALATAVETSKDGLALTDSDGLFTYMNAAHAKMFGYELDDIMGGPWSVLYKPQLVDFISEQVMAVLSEAGSWRGELEGKSKTGEPVFQEVVLTLRANGGLICSTRDIGERLQRERAAAELETRLLKAEREAALFTVGNAVAHDFINLITAISGYALLLKSDLEEDSASHERVSRILEAAEQASNVVRSLEVERNNDIWSMDEIDLVKLVRTGLAISEAIRPRGIQLDVELPETAIATCNEVLLSRVLINIAKNAFEAMGTSGQLSVRIGETAASRFSDPSHSFAIGNNDREAKFVLELTDTGPGIPSDKLEAIFTPFTTTKRAMHGTGLGLLSLTTLADTRAVSVEVETCPGVGTCFRLFFMDPFIDEHTAIRAPALAPHLNEQIRVLVVDDTAAVGQMLVETLERLGFEATWQSDPVAALEEVKTAPTRYHVLLTDLTMPGLAGDKLARKVREAGADLPVILYSGQSGYVPTDPIYADILTKPIAPEQLKSSIMAAVDAQLADWE